VSDISVRGDHVWCAAYGGIVRWDKRDGSYRQYTPRDIPWGGYGTRIAADTNDGLWYSDGSMLYHLEDGKTAVYDTAATGVSNHTIDRIISASDDTVWLSAHGIGVIRFDGLTRTIFSPADSIRQVYAVAPGPGGAVWFAAQNGAWRLDDGRWRRFVPGESSMGVPFYSAAADSAGNMWFGSEGAVYRFDGVSWKAFGKTEGIPDSRVQAMAADREGNVWCGTNSGIVRIGGGEVLVFKTGSGPKSSRVTGITPDTMGRVWFCHGLSGYGVSVYDHGVWSHRSPADSGLEDRAVRMASCDRTGVLWFGLDYGAVTFDGSVWRICAAESGLAAGSVNRLFCDSSGNVWFAYSGGFGISRFDGGSWTHWTVADGLRSDTVTAMGEGRDGAVYACATGGVCRLDGSSWTLVPDRERLMSDIVIDMTEAPDGAIWCATAGGLSRFDGASWRTWTAADGLPSDEVRAVCASPDGRIWVSFQNKLCCLDGTTFAVHPLPEGNGALFMDNLAACRDGTIWTDASKRIHGENVRSEGIWRFRNGTWDLAPFPPNMRNTDMYVRGVRTDGGESVWFGSEHGLLEWSGTAFVLHRTNTPGTFWCGDIIVDDNDTVWFSNGDISAMTTLSSFDGVTWRWYDGIDAPLLYANLFDIDERNGLWLYQTNFSRFDGISREIIFQWPDTLSLHPAVTAFSAGRNGILWMGTQEGLSEWDGKEWLERDLMQGSRSVQSLAKAPDGSLWIGTRDGVAWPVDGGHAFHRTNRAVFDIVVGSDGTAWAGTSQSLIRYDGSAWTEFTTVPGVGQVSGLCLAVERNGVLWAGTWNDGLLRYDGREWKRYTTSNGLTSNHINRIAVDHFNRKWISNGLCMCMLDDGPAMEKAEVRPAAFALHGVRPNPFNTGAMIEFSLPSAETVTLDIYDMLGRYVHRIERTGLPAGRNAIVWNGTDKQGVHAASGVYLYRLSAGGRTLSGRMTMVK